MRVQWRGVAKAVAAIAVCLVALQVLPELLRPPQAPPLAADVGLPRLGGVERDLVISEEEAKPRPAPKAKPKPRTSHGLSAATAVIGTTPRRHEPRRGQRPPDPPPAPDPPAYVPAPDPPLEPEFVPAPAPQPPPPLGDGSVEFAPH